MRFARAVFYFEAIFINTLVGLIALVAPGWFNSNFSPEPIPAVPLELLRWCGVLLIVLGYAMLRALPSRNEGAVALFVEALLVGDILHLLASVLFVQAGGAVNAAVVFMFGMSTFLAVTPMSWRRSGTVRTRAGCPLQERRRRSRDAFLLSLQITSGALTRRL